jgi:hypothetical protein
MNRLFVENKYQFVNLETTCMLPINHQFPESSILIEKKLRFGYEYVFAIFDSPGLPDPKRFSVSNFEPSFLFLRAFK